ncbi:Copine [Musa troglodytarum]|uniref:Copine n=2 Tax=Musa troglodytarum TaxID=320322 RepID=A0A9E7KKV8_9LILI|nr:Copine [Musa troglodytarum]
MGGGSSRVSRSRHRSYQQRSQSRDQSSPWGHNYSQDSAPSPPPPPPPSWSYASPPQAYPPPPPPLQQQPQHSAVSRPRTLDRRYSRISDNYNSLDQVTEALSQAGLESSNLIVGVDFTKSNEWTGKHSFRGRSLHHIGDSPNPYEQAMSIIGRTLSAFDEDNLIPCFGFGDASTHDQDIFSFYPDERPCNGFSEALERYKELVPHLRLAGPTSFAPIIEMAMTIVEESGGQYHVTRSVDTDYGQLSSQEHKTVEAIVKASEFPLSIVLVGVGDGPWDMMKEFDDNIPARAFDNFQVICKFYGDNVKEHAQARKETAFALAALMEIPSQYKATLELGILGRHSAKSPERVPLPPPVGGYGRSSVGSNSFKSTSFQQSAPSYSGYETAPALASTSASSTTPTAPSSSYDNQICPICLTNPKDMAFGCGHQTCCECGPSLQTCPICRSEIHTRIKLF